MMAECYDELNIRHMGIFQFLKSLRFGKAPTDAQLSGASTPTSSQADQQTLYSTDRPIHSKKDDRFNRARFAERIGDTLAKRHDPSSIVIGLYGPWGDGKTSTLHLIAEHLRTYPHVVMIHFNPWQFGSQETLIRGFFTTLAKDWDGRLGARPKS
jgi:KAP-like P-loop domain-containing protein